MATNTIMTNGSVKKILEPISLNSNTTSNTIKIKNLPVSTSVILSTSPASTAPSPLSSAHHRGLILLSKSSADERADNRKNENAEKKKRDEKFKLKSEKDARKVKRHIFF